MTTPPFLGNYFCLIPKSNLAFVMVSKNAVTHLKNVALAQATGEWPGDMARTHRMVGRSAESPFLVPVSEMPTWEAENGKRIKFAVWRDPIRRIESAYALFALDGVHTPYLDMCGVYADPSEAHFRRFLTFETSKPPLWIDPHFRAQSDYYTPSDVDVIIDVADVNTWLDAHGLPYQADRSNESAHGDYRIRDESWRSELRDIYAGDYAYRNLITSPQEF